MELRRRGMTKRGRNRLRYRINRMRAKRLGREMNYKFSKFSNFYDVWLVFVRTLPLPGLEDRLVPQRRITMSHRKKIGKSPRAPKANEPRPVAPAGKIKHQQPVQPHQTNEPQSLQPLEHRLEEQTNQRQSSLSHAVQLLQKQLPPKEKQLQPFLSPSYQPDELLALLEKEPQPEQLLQKHDLDDFLEFEWLENVLEWSTI